MSRTVATAFATYRAKVLPADASAVQITECERAFYAGTAFILGVLAEDLGDTSTSDADAYALLDRLNAELSAFAERQVLHLDDAPPPPHAADAPPATEAPAFGRPLWHQSGVNARGEPFVQLLLGEDVIAQLDVEMARDHAAAMLEAAEASEHDAFLLLFFQSEFELTQEAAGAILLRFRTVRTERTGKRGGPTTLRDWVRPRPPTDPAPE